MPQIARATAFTVSELSLENQQGGGGELPLSPPRIGLAFDISFNMNLLSIGVFYQHQADGLLN